MVAHQRLSVSLVHAMPDGISFISLLGGATWVHTIYASGKKLLVTQHSTGHGGPAKGRLSGKMMTGDCQITLR